MKCILLINLGASVTTGATKRYTELFNYIAEKRNDYLLVINKDLYKNLKKYNILKTDKNVIVLKISGSPKRKKNNTIVSGRTENQQIIIKKSEFRNFIGKRLSFLRNLRRWLLFVIYFTKMAKENNFKTVYAVFTGGIWVWPLTKIFGIKLVFSADSYSFADTFKDRLKFFQSDYWVLKYCDTIDFLSPQMKTTMEKFFLKRNPENYSVSPNSFIDYQNFYSEYPKKDYVLFMSRLEPHKNPLMLLEAANIFYKKYDENKPVNFIIMGTGSLDNRIRQYIELNNLNFVKFLGPVPNPFHILRKSKIFISIQDGNNYPSQSLLEAMSCENAIIASDVGETRLLVTENEGILVNLNAEEIADAIQKLFTTPGLIERLGKNARKKVLKEHTIEKFAEYFYSITDWYNYNNNVRICRDF